MSGGALRATTKKRTDKPSFFYIRSVIMRRKVTILVFIILFMSNTALATISIDNSTIVIHNNNIVGKAAVLKNGTQLWYDISFETERLPLQLGEGEYVISLFQHKKGNQYYKKESEIVRVLKNELEDVFLGSANPVYWSDDMEPIKIAKSITKNTKTDAEKVKAIYDYVTKNIKYDWEKLENISPRYVPNIEKIFKLKKGICYDYSALFASMLRSVGIRTKLIKGYREKDIYHAWNEVLIDGKWKIIDTTYGAAYVQANRKINMYQDENFYKKEAEF